MESTTSYTFPVQTGGIFYFPWHRHQAGLESNARPRRVKFHPGEWFVRPDQPGGRVGILRGFIDHIVIASLAPISSALRRQRAIPCQVNHSKT